MPSALPTPDHKSVSCVLTEWCQSKVNAIEYYSWINNFCFGKSTSLAFGRANPANQDDQSVLILFSFVIGILLSKLKRLVICLISLCDLYGYVLIIFDISETVFTFRTRSCLNAQEVDM